jgi:hypothetical protein
MFTTPTRHRLLAATAGLVLATGLLACGGDDSGDSSSDGTTATTTAPAGTTAPPTDDLAAKCEHYTTISQSLAGEPDPAVAGPAIDGLAETPPADIAAPTQTFTEGLRAVLEGDFSAFETPEFGAALDEVGSYYFDHCELSAQIEVTGADYAFSGIPEEEIEAGVVGIRFLNISASEEPHELFLMRRPDGDTRTADEIAQLDQETVFGEYQPVGVAFANAPDSSMSVLLNLEAGEYVAICNLPTAGDEADPHARHGMVAELSVA